MSLCLVLGWRTTNCFVTVTELESGRSPICRRGDEDSAPLPCPIGPRRPTPPTRVVPPRRRTGRATGSPAIPRWPADCRRRSRIGPVEVGSGGRCVPRPRESRRLSWVNRPTDSRETSTRQPRSAPIGDLDRGPGSGRHLGSAGQPVEVHSDESGWVQPAPPRDRAGRRRHVRVGPREGWESGCTRCRSPVTHPQELGADP